MLASAPFDRGFFMRPFRGAAAGIPRTDFVPEYAGPPQLAATVGGQPGVARMFRPAARFTACPLWDAFTLCATPFIWDAARGPPASTPTS